MDAPSISFKVSGTTLVQVVDTALKNRDELLDTLKAHMTEA